MKLLILAVLLWLAPATAHADPVSAAIVGFLGLTGTFAGAVIGAAVNAAIGLGLAFVAQALRGKPKTTQVGGASGRLQAGGAIRRSFVVGRGVAEATLNYANTYGADGGTPNAYLVQVIWLADLPGHDLAEVWVAGEKVTWNPAATPSTEGIAIPEYTVGGKEHLWLRYYDGTQTTADSRLVELFGSDVHRPYSATRVGYGVPYVVMTALVNPSLFTGFPSAKFVLAGIALYDRRADDTAGGEGDQRLATPATWVRSANPIVQAENILRGIRYDGQWVYGGQTTAEGQLPPASFFAGANECDAPVDLAAGGTEPQFETGGMIGFDVEPADAIEELLKSCNGRLAEVGGVYKVRVGSAGVAVMSFTDADLLSTSPQQFAPFPGLAKTVNGVTAKYVEPGEGWRSDKDAPALYSPALEAADGGRRQVADLSFGMVSSGTMVQRLMLAFRNRERAWRRHVLPLPPDAYPLEPLDLVSWSSVRNGYTDKLFDPEYIDDQPTLDIVATFKEVDPTADDWSTDDERPVSVAPLAFLRAPSQAMTGWQALPYTYLDGASTARRPGIEVRFSGGLEDVRAVRVQVRLAATAAVVFDGEVPYDISDETPSVALWGTFLPATEYEARGIFLPVSGRETSWSDWLAVTTPDVGLTEAELDARLRAFMQQLDVTSQAALANVIAGLDARLATLGQTVAGVLTLVNERIDGPGENAIVNYIGNANASITEARTIADGLADLFVSVFAGNEVTSGNALMRLTAGTGPDGSGASIKFLARALAGDILKEAGLELYAYADVDGGESGVILSGDKVLIKTPAGAFLNALLFVAQSEPQALTIATEGGTDVVRPDLAARQSKFKVTLDRDVQHRAPNNITAMDYVINHIQDGTGGRLETWSEDFVAPHPTALNQLPGAINVVRYSVIDAESSPKKILASFDRAYGPPTMKYRDIKQGGFFDNYYGASFIADISTLDFQKGNLLIAYGFGQAGNSGGGSGVAIDLGNSDGWRSLATSLDSASTSARRVLGLWKVAQGDESTLNFMNEFMTFGSSPYRIFGWSVLSFDILGGAPKVAGAGARTSSGSLTVAGDGYSAPLLSINFSLKGGSIPDQTFSETPDGDFTYQIPSTTTYIRTKFKLFTSSPADTTVSENNLVAGSFYLE
jgi:hypothetical protein